MLIDLLIVGIVYDVTELGEARAQGNLEHYIRYLCLRLITITVNEVINVACKLNSGSEGISRSWAGMELNTLLD